MSNVSSYSTNILLYNVNRVCLLDKMSRFPIKCVHCRVVSPSYCWDIYIYITSHLWLMFVSPSSISMRYYQRIVIDEELANLEIELYFWNMITKYHIGLILCIQCYCYSFYIKYHISAISPTGKTRQRITLSFRFLDCRISL